MPLHTEYIEANPDIATKIIMESSIDGPCAGGKALSMKDLLAKLKGIGPMELNIIANKLIQEGLLFKVHAPANDYLFGALYQSPVVLSSNIVKSGAIDCLIGGFPTIHAKFSKAVVPLELEVPRSETAPDGQGIGTAFLIGPRCLATAKHCIPKEGVIKIQGWDPKVNPVKKVIGHQKTEIDVVAIEFEKDLFDRVPWFNFEAGNILDDVITMGYPKIQGFQKVQVVEKAAIAAQPRGSMGQIVGKSKSYLGKQQLMLISARVNGGSSGGPVINKYGNVVSIITEDAEDHENSAFRTVGYGIATPISYLQEILEDSAENVANIPFTNEGDGVAFKNRPLTGFFALDL